MSTDTPAPFDANPFAEAEERYILSTVDPLESAPEADEHVEGPKLLTKTPTSPFLRLALSSVHTPFLSSATMASVAS